VRPHLFANPKPKSITCKTQHHNALDYFRAAFIRTKNKCSHHIRGVTPVVCVLVLPTSSFWTVDVLGSFLIQPPPTQLVPYYHHVLYHQPLYGYETPGIAEGGNDQTAAGVFKRVPGNSGVYYVPDEIKTVDLADFIQCPLPKYPAEVTFASHWLAVEGVQPRIPQNPMVVVAEEAVAGASSGGTASGGARAAAAASSAADSGGGSGGGGGGGAAHPSGPGKAKLEKRDIVKHELSYEQQLYYRSVTEGLLGTDTAYQDKALDSLRRDPGLHQLLPYFTQFIRQMVADKLGHLRTLTVLMRLCEALLENPSLYPEPYLHHILSAVLTCVVGKSINKDPAEDHWALRRLAARVLQTICAKFGQHGSPCIQNRITKTMIGALHDPSKSLATHFGAIITLHMLGENVVDAVLIDSIGLCISLSLVSIFMGVVASTCLFNGGPPACRVHTSLPPTCPLANPLPTPLPTPLITPLPTPLITHTLLFRLPLCTPSICSFPHPLVCPLAFSASSSPHCQLLCLNLRRRPRLPLLLAVC
jgi:hypothetical protein